MLVGKQQRSLADIYAGQKTCAIQPRAVNPRRALGFAIPILVEIGAATRADAVRRLVSNRPVIGGAEVVLEQGSRAPRNVAVGACRDHLAGAAGQLPVDALSPSMLLDDVLRRMSLAAGQAEAWAQSSMGSPRCACRRTINIVSRPPLGLNSVGSEKLACNSRPIGWRRWRCASP